MARKRSKQQRSPWVALAAAAAGTVLVVIPEPATTALGLAVTGAALYQMLGREP